MMFRRKDVPSCGTTRCPETLQREHEQRMSRLETTTEQHGKLLSSLELKMDSVVTTIGSAKAWVIGGVVTLAAKEFGLLNTLWQILLNKP